MNEQGLYEEIEFADAMADLERRYVEGCENARRDYYFNHCEAPVVADYGTTRELHFKSERSSPFSGGGRRGKIYKFSEAAAGRFQKAIRRSNIRFDQFVTVTFPPEIFWYWMDKGGWQGYVRHFMQELAKSCRARGIKYIWVREPQKNGRPHYHFLTSDKWIFPILCSNINMRYLSPRRATINRKNIKRKQISGGLAGVGRYMSKVARYCVKAVGLIHYESWRHWGRNFRDWPAQLYEASKEAIEYLISIFPKFRDNRFPNQITLDVCCPVGPPITYPLS